MKRHALDPKSTQEAVVCRNCGHTEDDHDGYGGLCDGGMDPDTRSMCPCVDFQPEDL